MDQDQVDQIVAATLAAAIIVRDDDQRPTRSTAIRDYNLMLEEVRRDRKISDKVHR